MGGLVGGLFDLFSGNPTAPEQGALQDVGNYGLNTGEGAINTGLGFEGDILSGDPSKIATALAPEIKAGQQQVQQQAEQGAMFGNRGGGTNAATQAAQSGERGNIINLIGGLQQGAAGAEIGAGENLLSQGTGAETTAADLALKNRQRQTSDVSGIAQGVADIAMPFLNPAAAAAPTAQDIVGTLNPQFAATQYGPEPGATDWSGLDTSGPNMSIFQ
jgi:NADH dehydrogenase/NADH:ubiquinone oxidoreductase subunit G